MTIETTERPKWTRRRPFGNHVAGTVAVLQKRVLNRDPAAIATMAHLRAAADKPPGADYRVLSVIAVPEAFLGNPGDEPTGHEWAKHTALTVYAFHQQSATGPMHEDGEGLGIAVSRLAASATSPDAVRRRFSALGAAMTYDATVYHLRGLVGLLKQKKLPLDYGLLADDLLAFRWPDGRDRVRARWGREFYRANPSSNDTEPKE